MGNKLIPLKQMRKMSKGEAYAAFLSELQDLVEHYFRSCVVKRDEMAELEEKLSSLKHYARYVKHACKVESENPFPDGYSFILINFIKKFGKEENNVNEDLAEVLTIYSKAIEKMIHRRQKRMGKDLDLPKEVVGDLAVIYPGDMLNKHNAWVFNRELSYRLFQIQKKFGSTISWEEEDESSKKGKKTTKDEATEPKEVKDMSNGELVKLCKEHKLTQEQRAELVRRMEPGEVDLANAKLIKKIYNGFFGDDVEVLEKVYANVMLDKISITNGFDPCQHLLWDSMTQWLVKAIEKLPMRSVQRVVEFYSARRNKDKNRDMDSPRRIMFGSLTYEEAPKLVTAFEPDKYSVKEIYKAEKKAKKKDKKKKKKK